MFVNDVDRILIKCVQLYQSETDEPMTSRFGNIVSGFGGGR